MPSGAKKRKAAKKKKEKEFKTNSSTHSHGDGDLKVHGEQESDGGEASSLASQDHHSHQHTFAEGEEGMEKREDTSSVQSIVTENEPMVGFHTNGESMQRVAMEENSVIQIDWELKSEDDSDGKNVSIEFVKSGKEPHGGQMSQDGGSSSSSSSSSDDESHVIEKNMVVIGSVESNEDAPNYVEESVAFGDSVNITDLPEVTQVADVLPVMDAYSLAVGEPKEEAYDPFAANAPSVNLIKPTDLPEVTQITDGIAVTEAYRSENVCKEVVHVNDSEPVENAINGKNESSGVPPVVMDLAPQPKEERVSSTSVENPAVTLLAASFAAKEDEDKLLPSSSVPEVDTSNGAEHIKGSVISECSDSQPLVASAPRPVQTTSWMSCCGLFEVFTGSHR